jgi:hypothetical protein
MHVLTIHRANFLIFYVETLKVISRAAENRFGDQHIKLQSTAIICNTGQDSGEHIPVFTSTLKEWPTVSFLRNMTATFIADKR